VMSKSCLATIVLASLAAVGSVVVDISSAVAAPVSAKQVPLPRPRPMAAATNRVTPSPTASSTRTAPAAAVAIAAPASATDVAMVKQAIDLLKAGKRSDASDIEKTIADPVARKLVEWIVLRDDDNGAEFARYNAFIQENLSWPSIGMFRRRAEAALWQERVDPAVVRDFFAASKPRTAKGRLALARALMVQGDRTAAQYYLREVWRADAISSDLEAQAIEQFRDLFTRADDKVRMSSRLYANDNEAALRAAQR